MKFSETFQDFEYKNLGLSGQGGPQSSKFLMNYGMSTFINIKYFFMIFGDWKYERIDYVPQVSCAGCYLKILFFGSVNHIFMTY